MSYTRLILTTALTMAAFATNSLLCRAALLHTRIDAASFTTIRLLSCAAMLWLILRIRPRTTSAGGDWISGFVLFTYSAGFSLAYSTLSTATGALILFGSIQVTMIGFGMWKGERLTRIQWLGLGLAIGAFVEMLLPGLAKPPITGFEIMLGAGVSASIYSLRGQAPGDPIQKTAGNFLRASAFAVALSLGMLRFNTLDREGIGYALISGALTTALGFALWYVVLPALKTIHASAVQLSVPVLAALGGVLFLGEQITLRLALTSLAVIGGIALVIREKAALGAVQGSNVPLPTPAPVSVFSKSD